MTIFEEQYLDRRTKSIYHKNTNRLFVDESGFLVVSTFSPRNYLFDNYVVFFVIKYFERI